MIANDRTCIRVGGAVLLAVVLLIGLVLGLEGTHLRPGIRVHVVMERIGPLKQGAPVRVSGRTIGNVEQVRFVPASQNGGGDWHAILDLWIANRYRWLFRANSDVFVNQAQVFGEATLEVSPKINALPGPVVSDEGTVRGIAPAQMDRIWQRYIANLNLMTDLLRNGVPEARILGKELAKLIGQVNGLPEAVASKRFMEELVKLEATISQADSRTEISAALQSFSETLGRGRAELGPIRDNVAQILANTLPLRRLLSRAPVGLFRTLVPRTRALIERAESLMAAAESLMAMVKRGEGSLGALLHDEELPDEIKDTSRLLKQQPWRAIGRH